MRLAFRRVLKLANVGGFTLLLLAAAMSSHARADGGFFNHFPQQVPGIDYSTGVPFLTSPYVYSKHHYGLGHGFGSAWGGHGVGCGCGSCAGQGHLGHAAGCGCGSCGGGAVSYGGHNGCEDGSCQGHGGASYGHGGASYGHSVGGAGAFYGSPYYGKKPMVFFGAGGPVYLNPGHPDSAGYINVTRSPRDFFAFPPYDPNPPY